ncbi:MAG: HDOD domain-containing protein [Fibrobacteria bacterium]|nr:HDOD domain-containing protein [Fibrobacteria bacterium]
MQEELHNKRRISSISNLPTLPEVASKLLQIINDPKTSSSDVADLISQDVGITSKVLRMANSAFYGIPRTITTVQNAVVLLGMKVINSLVLSVSVGDIFPAKQHGRGLKRLHFWKHSLSVAVCSRMLSQKGSHSHVLDSEECFCAGLLHDIGKLVLDQYYDKEFVETLNKAQADNISCIEAEMEILGFTHSNVGDWLTSKWELPRHLRIPLISHHKPESAENAKEATYVVHLADYLCHTLEYHCFPEEVFPPLQDDTMTVLGINDTALTAVTQNLSKEIEKLEAAFSFV